MNSAVNSTVNIHTSFHNSIHTYVHTYIHTSIQTSIQTFSHLFSHLFTPIFDHFSHLFTPLFTPIFIFTPYSHLIHRTVWWMRCEITRWKEWIAVNSAVKIAVNEPWMGAGRWKQTRAHTSELKAHIWHADELKKLKAHIWFFSNWRHTSDFGRTEGTHPNCPPFPVFPLRSLELRSVRFAYQCVNLT